MITMSVRCLGTLALILFFSSSQARGSERQGKLHFTPGKSSDDFPFRNVSLPWTDRINDLVSRLNIDEVMLQLARGGAHLNGPAPAVERLGIKPYNWNTECLRGYAQSGEATCFPQPIGLAATFNDGLINTIAKVISLEARAKYNNYTKNGVYKDHTGLSCFAPVINIMRHPLWGRNQETYGEDPVLTSIMAKAYVSGITQIDAATYPAASAVCKHFDVHGGPENLPVSRFGFNAVVSDHDLGTTFLPAFRACLGAGAEGVMCSYNAINGVPSCANTETLDTILRKTFKFKGYVVSDEGAIEHIDSFFHYTKTFLDTAIVSKNAGVDLELAISLVDNRFNQLPEAYMRGNVSEENLRDSAKRLFLTRMKLGEFDPPESVSWNKVPLDVIQSPEHRDLAIQAAAESFVLLKNNGLLPLSKTKQMKIAVLGPFANNPDALTGDYYTDFDLKYFSSPADAFRGFPGSVTVAKGCQGAWDIELPKCQDYNQSEVESATSGSDLVVVTLGTGRGIEAEGLDRWDMFLPGNQTQLLLDAVKFAKGAPILVLLFNAGPLDVSWALQDKRVSAMMACHFPAQSTGQALQKVLYSGGLNPAGRLPATWYASLDQVPEMTNYSMHERTYRYLTPDPLFPFGYGLSYTTFQYTKAQAFPSTDNPCGSVTLLVTVSNTGSLSGDEVVQVYQVSHNASVPTPQRQLVAFQRVNVEAGKDAFLTMDIQAFTRAIWKNGNYYVEPGDFTIYVGGQQPHQAVKVTSNVIELHFSISGKTVLLSDCEA